MFFLLPIVLVNFWVGFGSCELTSVVRTDSGPVQGEILSNHNCVKYAAFKGIPYARAPLGPLRFKPPVAPVPWKKVRNATVDGSDCAQINPFLGRFIGSEDCLFVNVVTPVTNLTKISGKLKSVIVWIYGGGLTSGTSSTQIYRPDYIIEKDVVYVSFNYRLGPLGFLSLRHRNATGNAGFKDQVFALKWIRANIKKFGGNPNNVTIFGESSGGIAAGFHVLSPASKGLFHGVIGMSAPPFDRKLYQTAAQAQIQAQKLGAAVGAKSNRKNDVLAALYRVSVIDLFNAAEEPSAYSFGLIIEDESIATDVFMSQCPLVLWSTGNFTKVPQMMGYTAQEAIWFMYPIAPIMPYLKETFELFATYRSEWPEKLVEAEKIVNSWTDGEIEDDDELEILGDVATDVIFKSQIDQIQRIFAANNDGKPIYYYQVSYVAEVMLHNIFLNSTLNGTAHSDELAFLFKFPQANYSTELSDPTGLTIHRMTTMWTNFAKYGNPTPNWKRDPSLDVSWPESGLAGTIFDIGTNLTVRPRSMSDVAKFVQLITWPVLGKLTGCHA